MFINLLLALTVVTVPRCSIGPSFAGPDSVRAIVLAVAVGETESVAMPDDPLYSHLPADSLRTAVGHRFRVFQATGGPGVLRTGDTFLAVPWAYDEGCYPELWTDPEWVGEGQEAVFTIGGTRISSRGEHITNQLGWHAPYPQGKFLVYSSRSADRTQWLTPQEYFALFSVLPGINQSGTSVEDRLAEIERVFADGDPRWSIAFPGNEILSRARARARSRGGY